MNCRKCNKPIKPGISVCPWCGYDNSVKPQNKPEEQRNLGGAAQQRGKKTGSSGGKQASKKMSKQNLILIISLSAVAAVLLIVILVMALRSGKQSSSRSGGGGGGTTPTTEETTTEEITMEDADTFYHKNAEVIAVTKATDSKAVLSEKDAVKELKARGFDQFPITRSYTMDGEFLEEDEIKDAGSDKRPMYETSYRTEAGDLWTISIVNDTYVAYPSSYNLEKQTMAVFSEKDSITAYDGDSNQFYQIKPKKELATLLTIDKVDAEHLEKLTTEEIDKLLK